MFEMTIIYPNGDFDVVQAPERWMLEQQATDMDNCGPCTTTNIFPCLQGHPCLHGSLNLLALSV